MRDRRAHGGEEGVVGRDHLVELRSHVARVFVEFDAARQLRDPPDVQPLQLDAVLRPALESLGLGDRADQIWKTMHDIAAPLFRTGVEEIEAARRDALTGLDEH
jgi:hypothetical protein